MAQNNRLLWCDQRKKEQKQTGTYLFNIYDVSFGKYRNGETAILGYATLLPSFQNFSFIKEPNHFAGQNIRWLQNFLIKKLLKSKGTLIR